MATNLPHDPQLTSRAGGSEDDASGPLTPAILVVDDNAAKRIAIRAMLAPLGIDVVEAESGREALRAIVRQTFAMVLMDVRMPTLDGYETAKLIRQRKQSESTPIMFVTAFGSDEVETETAYAGGAVDFIFTPIRPEVLRAKVAAFVGLFVQTAELQRSLESITTLNAALAASEVRSRAVLQNVADGIVTAGTGGLIESFNRAARVLFGYDEDEVIGQPLQLIVAPSRHEEFSESARAKWSLLNANGIPADSSETVGCRKDGSSFAMEMDVSQMQVGDETFTIACVRDISGRKAYTEALEHKALHDELTGLPNRTLFIDRLDREIAFADRADECRAVILVDLDKFGRMNEILGRKKADVLLQAVGRRLRGAMRDSDTVGHIQGDSFGILASGEGDVGTAAAIAWKVREVFEHPFLIAGDSVEVRASLGIAVFPPDGPSADAVLRRARLAVDQAKLSGEGLAVFSVDPEDQTARRLMLLNELRVGIGNGELALHYQPKIDLQGGQRTIGVEALVRWQHPRDGLLMPAQFMPEVEQSELIDPLTNWVLNEAVRQQHVWSEAGIDLTMAVNVSARTLTQHTDLPDAIARLTERWDIAPGRLIIEITENDFIDSDMVNGLDLLHAMGEELSIDDFGTGHSCLAYLQRLPIDEIKIDRSFVISMPTVAGDAMIVHSTIDLAHNLGLRVVAEGIEDEAALKMLVDDGCDIGQGYFFSRPCPAEELTKWLTESRFGVGAGKVSGRTV
jgi:diguanylate cyclase (GGDEF)-like protein/PAS domain S-box-containing protein